MQESVNTQALLNLASSKIQQALSSLGGTSAGSTDVQASLVRQAAEQHQKDVDVAALEILKLKRNKQDFLATSAAQLVSLETQIANLKALAAKANLADVYGDHSDNYLPLQKIIGGAVPSSDKSLIEVPAGWAVPTATTAS